MPYIITDIDGTLTTTGDNPNQPYIDWLKSQANDFGFEVIVVRQIIERRIAPEMYRAARTGESGMMRPKVIRPRTELVQ